MTTTADPQIHNISTLPTDAATRIERRDRRVHACERALAAVIPATALTAAYGIATDTGAITAAALIGGIAFVTGTVTARGVLDSNAQAEAARAADNNRILTAAERPDYSLTPGDTTRGRAA